MAGGDDHTGKGVEGQGEEEAITYTEQWCHW